MTHGCASGSTSCGARGATVSIDIYLEAATFIIRERIRHATGAIKCSAKTKRDAVSWIMSDDTGRGSFLRWCDAAGIDPLDIRDKVTK